MNAIITGGTKGIGLAITERLLKEGLIVIATYSSDSANAMAIKERLECKYPGQLSIIQKHLEVESDVRDFVNECREQNLLSAGLDFLVLNAGTTDRTKWNEITWDKWEHVMNVNINAPAQLVRELNDFINDKGSILFISSDMSIYPHATSVPYTVSKAAINGLTLALVKEYADKEIRVNAILPGFVETPWQKQKPEEQKKRICDKVALGRFANPAEIADIAFDILKSTYINGSLVKVDGGYCFK